MSFRSENSDAFSAGWGPKDHPLMQEVFVSRHVQTDVEESDGFTLQSACETTSFLEEEYREEANELLEVRKELARLQEANQKLESKTEKQEEKIHVLSASLRIKEEIINQLDRELNIACLAKNGS